MAFEVNIMARAEQDIRAAMRYILVDSPAQAMRWYRELRQLIDSLNTFPKRFAVLPESRHFGEVLRSCLHYSHRIVYAVYDETETVMVLRLYHTAEQPIQMTDLR